MKNTIAPPDRKIGLRKAQTAAGSASVRQSKSKDKPKATAPAPKTKAPKAHKAHALEPQEPTPGAETNDPDGDADGVEGAHHRHHRHHVHRHAIGHDDDELDEPEELAESAATGADAIRRSKGDAGGGDGFEGERDQREAYERWLRGNVGADQERIDALRRTGKRDDFAPDRTPAEVEALGVQRASAHVVRLYETWTLAGVPRGEALERAATFLARFTSTQSIRKVLQELESRPIRDVYPLEVLMRLLDERPELLPGVRRGSVIGNASALESGERVFAGHPVVVEIPRDVRLKQFALLGGGRPGYEVAPHVEEGKYTLLVDTAGVWRFAVLAAPLQQLGRIQRETAEAILEVFTVTVHEMGRKGEPVAADEEGDDDDADDVARAPPLAVQVREQLERIARDDESTTHATTYSWDARFHAPNASFDDEPILHVVVERAGPFDVAWVRAREAIAAKQKEWEPGRACITADDVTAALRRARVR